MRDSFARDSVKKDERLARNSSRHEPYGWPARQLLGLKRHSEANSFWQALKPPHGVSVLTRDFEYLNPRSISIEAGFVVESGLTAVDYILGWRMRRHFLTLNN
jgi:hypothetical protein